MLLGAPGSQVGSIIQSGTEVYVLRAIRAGESPGESPAPHHLLVRANTLIPTPVTGTKMRLVLLSAATE